VVGDYQVVKLGDITALKNPETKMLVKITDEDKSPQRTAKTKKKSKGMESLTSAGFKLFDKFRELRLEIAREESMPPYIIFSDKTLIDMAVKVPTSKSEMLNVSGVGENKFVKYGDRFLGLIEECIGEYPELIQNKKGISQREKSESTWLAEKREEHAGAYMPWTEEEERKLTNEFESGQFSTRDLSEIHGRTTGAIRARLKKLDLIE
jgi:ATP-dependent DNA helicase RecQ